MVGPAGRCNYIVGYGEARELCGRPAQLTMDSPVFGKAYRCRRHHKAKRPRTMPSAKSFKGLKVGQKIAWRNATITGLHPHRPRYPVSVVTERGARRRITLELAKRRSTSKKTGASRATTGVKTYTAVDGRKFRVGQRIQIGRRWFTIEGIKPSRPVNPFDVVGPRGGRYIAGPRQVR